MGPFGRVQPKETGRPGYAPGDLLKLYIYGYLNRIRSSRRLEADAHRNVEVIWLPRRLKPDFKTLADFRRDNRNAFRAVFRQFVLLCRQLDLFGRELLAVDGTRIKAVNNKDRNFTRASLTEFIKLADARLDDYLQRLDTSDADEQAAGGSRVKNLAEKIAAIRQRRARCQAMLAELDRTGEDQIRSPTRTAGPWRRTRTLRSATTPRSRWRCRKSPCPSGIHFVSRAPEPAPAGVAPTLERSDRTTAADWWSTSV